LSSEGTVGRLDQQRSVLEHGGGAGSGSANHGADGGEYNDRSSDSHQPETEQAGNTIAPGQEHDRHPTRSSGSTDGLDLVQERDVADDLPRKGALATINSFSDNGGSEGIVDDTRSALLASNSSKNGKLIARSHAIGLLGLLAATQAWLEGLLEMCRAQLQELFAKLHLITQTVLDFIKVHEVLIIVVLCTVLPVYLHVICLQIRQNQITNMMNLQDTESPIPDVVGPSLLSYNGISSHSACS